MHLTTHFPNDMLRYAFEFIRSGNVIDSLVNFFQSILHNFVRNLFNATSTRNETLLSYELPFTCAQYMVVKDLVHEAKFSMRDSFCPMKDFGLNCRLWRDFM